MARLVICRCNICFVFFYCINQRPFSPAYLTHSTTFTINFINIILIGFPIALYKFGEMIFKCIYKRYIILFKQNDKFGIGETNKTKYDKLSFLIKSNTKLFVANYSPIPYKPRLIVLHLLILWWLCTKNNSLLFLCTQSIGNFWGVGGGGRTHNYVIPPVSFLPLKAPLRRKRYIVYNCVITENCLM